MDEEQVFQGVRAAALAAGPTTPASPEAVAEVEQLIGRPMPPLYKRLLLEASNGGFGPGYGVMGVRGGVLVSENLLPTADLAGVVAGMREPGFESTRLPSNAFMICDWGGTVFTLLDFDDPDAALWGWDQGDVWAENFGFVEWLARWLEGELPRTDSRDHPEAVDYRE